MTRVEVKTQTTYVINLPIDSFEEIMEDKMSLTDSDKMIMDCLDNLWIGVDKIIGVLPVNY